MVVLFWLCSNLVYLAILDSNQINLFVGIAVNSLMLYVNTEPDDGNVAPSCAIIYRPRIYQP